jgi:hypothetical protein
MAEQRAGSRLLIRRREHRQERSLRVVFSLCALCLVLAIWSGYRIVTETHLHTEPSPISGVAAHRDSIDAVEQAQRIRASRLEITAVRPVSTVATILDALSDR